MRPSSLLLVSLALSVLGIGSAVSCQQGDPLPGCDVGLYCNGGCYEPEEFDDVDNCGACGYPCAEGQICQDGDCCYEGYDCVAATGSTGPGGTYCSGEWVDLDTDVAHCGACNNHCGIVEDCIDGECVAEATTTMGPLDDSGSSSEGSSSDSSDSSGSTGSSGSSGSTGSTG